MIAFPTFANFLNVYIFFTLFRRCISFISPSFSPLAHPLIFMLIKSWKRRTLLAAAGGGGRAQKTLPTLLSTDTVRNRPSASSSSSFSLSLFRQKRSAFLTKGSLGVTDKKIPSTETFISQWEKREQDKKVSKDFGRRRRRWRKTTSSISRWWQTRHPRGRVKGKSSLIQVTFVLDFRKVALWWGVFLLAQEMTWNKSGVVKLFWFFLL